MSSKMSGSNMSDAIGQWCSATTWHGISDFYKTRSSVAKLFWLAVIVFSLFNITFQILSFLVDFLGPNKWAVTVGFQPAQNGMPFPNVTICNLNQYNLTRIKERNITEKAGEDYSVA